MFSKHLVQALQLGAKEHLMRETSSSKQPLGAPTAIRADELGCLNLIQGSTDLNWEITLKWNLVNGTYHKMLQCKTFLFRFPWTLHPLSATSPPCFPFPPLLLLSLDSVPTESSMVFHLTLFPPISFIFL